MELPGRCGDWLDTATVTVQGFKLRLDTTSKGWGLLLGHQRGLLNGHLRGLSHGHGQPVGPRTMPPTSMRRRPKGAASSDRQAGPLDAESRVVRGPDWCSPRTPQPPLALVWASVTTLFASPIA